MYHNAGELTLAQDNNSLYNCTYHSGGQLTGEPVTYPGYSSSPLVTLGFTYDAFGNRIGMTDSLGGSMGYTFNGENQMTGASLAVSGTTSATLSMSYDGLARLSGTTMSSPSGATIASSDTYDNAGRLTNISYKDGGSTLASYTYGYNAASQITSYQGLSYSLSYTCLQDGELYGASGTLAGSTYSVTYNYDANGNRTSTSTDIGDTITNATYTTATGNEMTGDGTNTYTFDNNGNTLTQTNTATGTVTHFTWDYENRLTDVKVVSSGGTVLNDEKFTYDVFGNRICVSLNGTQTLYTVYDGSNPYMDFNGSGSVTERYLYNPYAQNQFYGQVNRSGTTEWFVTDNLNSIRQVLSTSGTSLATIVYDPFGQLMTSLNSYAPRFLYTGGAYDAITGMYTDGAREENPLDGRWMSQDSTRVLIGHNPYEFTVANLSEHENQKKIEKQNVGYRVEEWYLRYTDGPSEGKRIYIDSLKQKIAHRDRLSEIPDGRAVIFARVEVTNNTESNILARITLTLLQRNEERESWFFVEGVPSAYVLVRPGESRYINKSLSMDLNSQEWLRKFSLCMFYYQANDYRRHNPIPVQESECVFTVR